MLGMKNWSKKAAVAVLAMSAGVTGYAKAETSLSAGGATFPAPIYKRWIEEYEKKNPDVKVEAEHELAAYQGKITGPYADAIRASMKFAFGKEPVFVREGGSIGAVLSMEKVFRSPVFFLGLSLPEHGYHAPNENFDWAQARGGMAAFADYFRRVAAMA